MPLAAMLVFRVVSPWNSAAGLNIESCGNEIGISQSSEKPEFARSAINMPFGFSGVC